MSKPIRIEQTVRHTQVVELNDEEALIVTATFLKRKIPDIEHVDSWWFEGGDLWVMCDHGHHRGGEIEDKLRPATALDLRIGRILVDIGYLREDFTFRKPRNALNL